MRNTCHSNVQPPLPSCSAHVYNWQAGVFYTMNKRFDKAAKDDAEQATQRRLDRVSSGMRQYGEDAVSRACLMRRRCVH